MNEFLTAISNNPGTSLFVACVVYYWLQALRGGK